MITRSESGDLVADLPAAGLLLLLLLAVHDPFRPALHDPLVLVLLHLVEALAEHVGGDTRP